MYNLNCEKKKFEEEKPLFNTRHFNHNEDNLFKLVGIQNWSPTCESEPKTNVR